MTGAVHIVLRGQPKAWKRPRYNPKTRSFFKAADDDFFHGLLRSEAARIMEGRDPLDGPIELSLLAVFAIPGSWSKKRQQGARAGFEYKTGRPDLDNLIKGVKDALTRVVYRDDALIVSYGACSKIFGAQPRLEIVLTPILAVQEQLGWPLSAEPDLFAGAAS